MMGDISSSSRDEAGEMGSWPALPILWEMAFRLAFWALRSVALVSFRKTRSNSSLYPGHWRLDLAHWLQVGFVSSHYGVCYNAIPAKVCSASWMGDG
jgi:hypothetical protein